VSTPVPFPYSRPVEASIMGGAHWKDNGDGTFTNLANGTMNPASGFSYLELYLMGFLPASKVPDFFILRNQQSVGRTPAGQNIVKAEKVAITIQDVIAHNGPRVPSFEDSRKAYNTALVAVTLKGRQPTPSMLAQLEGIRSAWIGYWSKVTGGVSTMETSPGKLGLRRTHTRVVPTEARRFAGPHPGPLAHRPVQRPSGVETGQCRRPRPGATRAALTAFSPSAPSPIAPAARARRPGPRP
jgi:hypothetical protein